MVCNIYKVDSPALVIKVHLYHIQSDMWSRVTVNLTDVFLTVSVQFSDVEHWSWAV